MENIERLVREFAWGKVNGMVKGKQGIRFEEYLTMAYLGRLVLVVSECKQRNITEGPAIDQFLELATYVNFINGGKSLSSLVEELSKIVERDLDDCAMWMDEKEKRQVSLLLSVVVPTNNNRGVAIPNKLPVFVLD